MIGGIGADKKPKESDINFDPGTMVYSSKHQQAGLVVTKREYGQRIINNAQTPVFFPQRKKIVAVYNRYLTSLSDEE